MESGRSKNWQIGFVCAALALVTLAAFWPVRFNDFINYDDQEYIYENSHVQAGLTRAGLRWAFTTGHASNWHPLTWLSHMLDVQLFGLRPGAHHLTSVTFHIANSLLLFSLLLRLTEKLWRSAFVSSLFALHPLHVESVAWAAERKDVLSAFFFLLTLLAYVRYAQLKVQGQKSRLTLHASGFYALSVVFYALGLMSKPMLVTVPFVLLLLDYWPLKRFQPGANPERCCREIGKSKNKSIRGHDSQHSPKTEAVSKEHLQSGLAHGAPSPGGEGWAEGELISNQVVPGKGLRRKIPLLLLEKAPFLLLSFASSIVTILVQQRAMIVYKALPFPYRAANAAVSYVRYLFKTFWPRDLAVMYPHPGIWPVSQISLSVILLLIITLALLWLGRGRPWLPVGWLWFVGMLVPVIGLVQVGVQAMADRYTYLPLIGLFVLLTWQAAHWATVSKTRMRFAAVGAGVLLAACAAQTHTQATLWKDTETVFTHDLEVVPNSWIAHHNLALMALDRYQKTERGSVASQGLGASTGNPLPAARHDYLQQVIDHCEAALAAKPSIAEVHVTLAKALTEQGKLDEARSHLDLAIRADPKNAQAKQTLAEILHRQGHAREAAAAYRATLELEPDWGPVLNNLAWLLATSREDSVRNGPEAVRLAERVCNSTARTNFWYLHTLAAAYAETGDFTNAVLTAEQARRLTELTGSPDLIKKADTRILLYKSGAPLRDP